MNANEYHRIGMALAALHCESHHFLSSVKRCTAVKVEAYVKQIFDINREFCKVSQSIIIYLLSTQTENV